MSTSPTGRRMPSKNPLLAESRSLSHLQNLISEDMAGIKMLAIALAYKNDGDLVDALNNDDSTVRIGKAWKKVLIDLKEINEGRVVAGSAIAIFNWGLLPTAITQSRPILQLLLLISFSLAILTTFVAISIRDNVRHLRSDNPCQAICSMKGASNSIYAPGQCLQLSVLVFVGAIITAVCPRTADSGAENAQSRASWIIFGITVGFMAITLLSFFRYASLIGTITEIDDSDVEAMVHRWAQGLADKSPHDHATSGIYKVFRWRQLRKISGDLEGLPLHVIQSPMKLWPPGLINSGQTCFVGAVLQCFNALNVTVNPAQGQLAAELFTILNLMKRDNPLPRLVDPTPFYDTLCHLVPKFAHHQQDAAEFISAVCENCTKSQYIQPDEITDASPGDGLLLEEFCVGVLFRPECLACKKGSDEYQIMHTIPLFVPSPNSSLSDCFDTFFKKTKLGDWKCECAAQDCRIHGIILAKAPSVLVIQLKRYNFDQGTTTKLSWSAPFPLSSLDISNYVRHGESDNPQLPDTYDLCAVVNHLGTDTNSGHYTATVLLDGRWVNCDDRKVVEIKEDIVGTPSYLLFYRKSG